MDVIIQISSIVQGLLLIAAAFLIVFWVLSEFVSPLQSTAATVERKFSGRRSSYYVVLNWGGSQNQAQVRNFTDYQKYTPGQQVQVKYRHYNLLVVSVPVNSIVEIDGRPTDLVDQISTLLFRCGIVLLPLWLIRKGVQTWAMYASS